MSNVADVIELLPWGVEPVLLGVTGSRLYGLHHEDSDYDWKGVYQASTSDVLSLTKPKESYTYSDPNPDFTIYEVERFLSLLLKANPTVLEMLWLPEYAVLTEPGRWIVNHRLLFMTNKIRPVYLGFATGQAKEFSKKRTAKSARHAIRVIEQGVQALTTAIIDPVVAEPGRILEIGQLAEEKPNWFLDELLPRAVATLETCESILPEAPDIERINGLLVSLRMAGI